MTELVRVFRMDKSSFRFWLQYQGDDGKSEWRRIDLEDLLAKELRESFVNNPELFAQWKVEAGIMMSENGYVVDPGMLYATSEPSEPPKVRFTVDTRPRVLADVADPGVRRLGGEKMFLIRRWLLEHAAKLLEKETWQVYIEDMGLTVLGVTRENESNRWLVISSILEGNWLE